MAPAAVRASGAGGNDCFRFRGPRPYSSGERTDRADCLIQPASLAFGLETRRWILISACASRPLPLGADRIDIAEWLFSLGDDEYRRTSRAHLGAGTFRLGDGRRGFFDAEAFPATLIVNHHVEEESRRDYVRVRSRDSRGWLLGVLPVPLELCWEMVVHGRGPDRSELECRLHIGLPSERLEPFARALGVPVLQRRHVAEQTRGFADSVTAKFKASARHDA